MRPNIRLLLWVALLPFVCAGCASVGGYFADRGRDASDILSLSFGTGIGAGVRAGPVNVALIRYAERAGFRGARFHLPSDYDSADWLGSWRVPDTPRSLVAGRVSIAGDDIFVDRGKGFTAEGSGNPFILVPTLYDEKRYPVHFYSQIDVAMVIGGGLRLSFNPGELLDFLLGWTMIDIFADDLSRRRERDPTTD